MSVDKPLAVVLAEAKAKKESDFQDKWKQMKTGVGGWVGEGGGEGGIPQPGQVEAVEDRCVCVWGGGGVCVCVCGGGGGGDNPARTSGSR